MEELFLHMSVSKFSEKTKQPYGGYLQTKDFLKESLNDGIVLNEKESVKPQIIGLAVDYLARLMMGFEKEKAFSISLAGATKLSEYNHDKAYRLLSEINDLSDNSIFNACKLVGYDVVYRAGTLGYKEVNSIKADSDTIFNIRTMVERTIFFFNKYGPITHDGITFPGGYTQKVVSGDADFLTKNALWDLKVKTKGITSKDKLQILVYYLLGLRSYETCDDFENLDFIGIYNPRRNIAFRYPIKNISEGIISEVKDKMEC